MIPHVFTVFFRTSLILVELNQISANPSILPMSHYHSAVLLAAVDRALPALSLSCMLIGWRRGCAVGTVR